MPDPEITVKPPPGPTPEGTTPEKPPKIIVAHYTDAGGLIGILGNNQFWASKSTFMNDPGEIAYAWKVYKDEFARRSPAEQVLGQVIAREVETQFELQDMFILSMSHLPDDLTMWDRYGGRGYSLHIDINDLIGRIPPETKRWLAGAYRVFYGRDFQDRVAKNLVSAYLQEQAQAYAPDMLHSLESAKLKSEILSTVYAFKHDAFRGEAEARLLFQVSNLKSWLDPSIWRSTVKFRARDGRIVPYLEVPLTTRHWLKAVVLGPKVTDPREKEGLQLLMASKGYDVPILESSCPYR